MDELDPAQRIQLDALGEEYYRRHGVAVEFLKAEVGTGEEYRNEAARAVLSPNGAWCECLDLPMEFTGLTGGPVEHRFISAEAFAQTVERLYTWKETISPDTTRLFSLFVLYTRAGIVDARGVYVFHQAQRAGSLSRPQVVGTWRPEALPLFFRCRIDTQAEAAELPLKRGVVFGLAHIGEKNLLAVLPYESSDMRDLSTLPITPAIQ